MKKRLLTVGLLVLCLVLAACTAKDPSNLFETTDGNPSDTITSLIVTTESSEPRQQSDEIEFDDSVLFEEGYQYGNMQKNVPSGNFMRLGNEVLFGYLSNGRFRLYYYDLMAGDVHLYCKNATCTHKSCGFLDFTGNLEVYKGKVYLRNRATQAVEVDASGSRHITASSVKRFIHHDDKLYVTTADASLVVFDEGVDKPRMILEEHTGFWHVIFGQYMFANTVDHILRVDLTADVPAEEVVVANAGGITDGKHIYYVDRQRFQLYRCDMDGSNPQLLVEKPVLLASMNFDNEYFYYRLLTDQKLDEGADAHDIYRFSKSEPTQIEKIVSLPVPVYEIFTVPESGKIFVLAYVMSNGENHDIYVMGTDGSSITRLEIPEY